MEGAADDEALDGTGVGDGFVFVVFRLLGALFEGLVAQPGEGLGVLVVVQQVQQQHEFGVEGDGGFLLVDVVDACDADVFLGIEVDVRVRGALLGLFGWCAHGGYLLVGVWCAHEGLRAPWCWVDR